MASNRSKYAKRARVRSVHYPYHLTGAVMYGHQQLEALVTFVAQRSGIEYADYGERHAFMSDYRPILRHGQHARTMLAYLRWRTLAPDFLASVAGPSGRLTWDATRGQWDYCTGQYFPTEYRRAACRLLASATETVWRNDAGGCVSRDDIVAKARREFGRAIASTWFR
jgi:hypothetical protein